MNINRSQFEFQVEPLLQRCMDVVTGVLTVAGFTTVHSLHRITALAAVVGPCLLVVSSLWSKHCL